MKLLKTLLAATVALSLTACAAPKESNVSTSEVSEKENAKTVTIIDHADREVTVPTNPGKVAILGILPLPAMLTIYLNSADSLVAMEPASMNAAKNGVLSELYPEILNVSTDIMNGEDVNIEALVSLSPDVVFCNAANKKIIEKISNAGLTAVGVSPTKWNYNCIKTYDEWMNLLNQIYPDHDAKREKLVDTYANDTYNEIQDKVKDITDKQKVLFLYQYDENTMVTSSSKFFGQWWCDAVGAENVAKDVPAENSNAVITMEQVYEWNPDVIFITNFTPTTPDNLYNNEIGDDDWSMIKAVQDKRVYKMPLGSYRTYTPGIDTPMTLEWIAQAVYPDLFNEYDVKNSVKKYYKELYNVELTDKQIEVMYSPNKKAGSMN